MCRENTLAPAEGALDEVPRKSIEELKYLRGVGVFVLPKQLQESYNPWICAQGHPKILHTHENLIFETYLVIIFWRVL